MENLVKSNEKKRPDTPPHHLDPFTPPPSEGGDGGSPRSTGRGDGAPPDEAADPPDPNDPGREPDHDPSPDPAPVPPIPAGPWGPCGYRGPQGIQGPEGPQGPPSGASGAIPAKYSEGLDWRQHRIDPRTISTSTVHISSGVRTIPPWKYPRAETGSLYNYAVCLDVGIVCKDQYLDNLKERLGTEAYTVKNFCYNFPCLPNDCSRANLCTFYHAVCAYAHHFGVYVPPFITQIPHTCRGAWFPDLPLWCTYRFGFYDENLRLALLGKNAALSHSPLVAHLVREPHGYAILFKIAKICGHPALSDSIVPISVPRQRSDTDFLAYLHQWQHYAYIQFCQGVNFSDRYFTERFITEMHSVFNATLKPHMLMLLRRVEVNTPLVFYWWPDQILDYLITSAARIGLTITTDTTPREFAQPRRTTTTSTKPSTPPAAAPVSRLSRSSRAMRQLLDEPSTVAQVTEDDNDLAYAIRSLMAAPCTCSFCTKEGHLAAACPDLAAILSDPDRRRCILHLMQSPDSNGGGTNDSSRNATPPRRNIRSIDANDTDTNTDTDLSVHQIDTDDDASTVGSVPDFH